jgi:PKD repeat protein
VYDVKLKLESGNYADSLIRDNYISAIQPLVANFTESKTSALVGELIFFTDLSLGNPTSWLWTFGDNNISTLQNPAHLYTQPGIYTIGLLIQKEGKSDLLIKNDHIEIYYPLVADFETDKTLCLKGESVQFTDLSQGDPDFWAWDFGDGEVDFNQHPEHIYSETGVYPVKLKVASAWRTDSITKENLITVVDPLIADFEANRTFVYTGEEIQFTDLSTGNPINWTWDFGDANISSLQNPGHAYELEGNYTISLKILNTFLEDSIEKINYILVIDPLIADFIADTTKVLIGQTIQFSDMSSGSPTLWVWDFGDTSNGIGPNTEHHYEATGDYSVSLQVFHGDSTDIEVKENYIEVRDSLIADLFTNTIEVRAGDPVQFFDNSSGGPTQWFWDFGVTKINPLQNPVYTYQNPGIYSVQLVVKNDFDTDTIFKENYITVLPAIVTQNIVLAEGWGSIATYINPLNSAIEELLAPLGENHIFSMNYNGIYWPAQNINTINNWDPYDGLIIKMAASDTLTISGESELNPQARIFAGWSILPVVNSCPEITSVLHEVLGDTVVLIKEIAGTKVSWPEYGINTLEMLEPGKSYFTLAGFETNYQYCECDGEFLLEKSVTLEETFNPWNAFTKTPQSHLIVFLPNAVRLPGRADKNTTIGVFNENGVCSGILNINEIEADKSTVMVAFGQDANSPGLSGFSETEEMNFRIFENTTQKTLSCDLTFDVNFPDQDRFANNGLSGISGIEITRISEVGLPANEIFIYPNPGNGIFYIDLSFLGQPARIEVLNSGGRLLKPGLAEINGITSIDLSGRAKGIYLVKIISGPFSTTKKIVLR